jgi:DNA-binding XRE family transcriptional regulator/quercetin dioxygenase-like cupin family protein
MDDLARLVGERLRAARRERGLSLGALAEAAHVGKGSLSEIENGARNPTLGTLYALAGALGAPLATLIADRPGTRVASPGIEARLLDVSRDAGSGVGSGTGSDAGSGTGSGTGSGAGSGGGQTVEVYRLRIEPGHIHRSPAHGPGVTEHLLVTSGRARAGRRGEETEIGPGQAAQWVSDVPHTYAALGPGPVESVLVIRSPERPLSRIQTRRKGRGPESEDASLPRRLVVEAVIRLRP